MKLGHYELSLAIGGFLLSGCVAIGATAAESKTLIDFFLPMEPQGALVSEGIWGADTAIPRDVKNGLEDPDVSDWVYWDGQIVKDDEGKYHMFASRWDQNNTHAHGWRIESRGTHAVSDHLLGPYEDLGEMWPHWQDGLGHNVVGLRMHDGRWAAISSESTPGDIFVADSPYGPWEYLGEPEVDPNGYYSALGRYDELDSGAFKNNKTGYLSNVMIILRPDNRYMMLARHCAPMISDNGILGPYKIMADKAWRGIEGFPQFKNEDPTIWYSDGLYHIVVNHHGSGDMTYHLTSEDGIHNWKNRGMAFDIHKKDFFRYSDGTANWWQTVQRPTVYIEDGIVRAFNFSVIDVGKGGDRPNDNHGSKIVVVPFDGEAFGRHMRELVRQERAMADATPPPAPWKSVNIGTEGLTGYQEEFNTILVRASGQKDDVRFVYKKMSGDVSATVQVLSHELSEVEFKSGLMFRSGLEARADLVAASISTSGGFAFEKLGEVLKRKEIRAPYWLRMEKRENKITSYVSSSNRMNWEKIGETDCELGDEFYVGMATRSLEGGKECLARFKDVDVHVYGQPVKDGIVNHTFPDVIPPDGQITFEVDCESNQSLEAYVELENVKTRRKFVALRKQLKHKSEVVELTYDVGPLTSGDSYWFSIKMLPLHGHESMAVDSMFKKVVVE